MIRFVTLVLVAVLPLATGCRILALMFDEPTKPVPAEYPYLADKKVCILVRAPEETVFEHPHVLWEIADHVRLALEANVPGVKVVDPRKITDLQRREPDWDLRDPALIGRQFEAERVLEVDLTQYTTREPESPHLYRGHIAAAVRVYNTEYTNAQAAYRGDVQTVYPPDGPGQWGTTDREIRRATMETFALDVAGKFYERRVKVK